MTFALRKRREHALISANLEPQINKSTKKEEEEKKIKGKNTIETQRENYFKLIYFCNGEIEGGGS